MTKKLFFTLFVLIFTLSHQPLLAQSTLCNYDYICDPTEDSVSCPMDCSEYPMPDCGNGIIEMGEDCDDGNFVAGDGCTPACINETAPPYGSCNYDYICDPMEDQMTCPMDCSSYEPVCGDGFCSYPETDLSCSEDCSQPNITMNLEEGTFCGEEFPGGPVECTVCSTSGIPDVLDCSMTKVDEYTNHQMEMSYKYNVVTQEFTEMKKVEDGVEEQGQCTKGDQEYSCGGFGDDPNDFMNFQCTDYPYCVVCWDCTIVATTSLCGNGIVEVGEDCDDGNIDNEDGCSSLCKFDGYLENQVPPGSCNYDYICDPTEDSMHCPSDCGVDFCSPEEIWHCKTEAECIFEGGQWCSDTSGEWCSDLSCGGAGSGAGEFCFDETDNDGDTLIDCLDPDCQDSDLIGLCSISGAQFIETAADSGIFIAQEIWCDDGFDNDGDGLADCDDDDCSSYGSCAPEPECGNGILEANEECDDGNLTEGDSCNASCLLECGYLPPDCPETYWSRFISDPEIESSLANIALDGDENIYLSGSIETSLGNKDIFVQKYDRCGNYRWSRTVTDWSEYEGPGDAGASFDSSLDITTDSEGDIYFTGRFNVDGIGSEPLTRHTLTRKVDACGNELWTSHFLRSWSDLPYEVHNDGFGNVYVCGESALDGFIEKYSAATGDPAVGNWPFIVPENESPRIQYEVFSIIPDPEGNIFALVGALPLMSTPIDLLNYRVMKITPSGELDLSFGELGEVTIDRDGVVDWGHKLTLDLEGNIYVVGRQEVRENFSISSTTLSVYKIDPTGLVVDVSSPLISLPPHSNGIGIATDDNANIYILSYEAAVSRPILMKYNPDGELLWRDVLESYDGSFYSDISLGAEGDVYVVGTSFEGDSIIHKYSPCGNSIDGPPNEQYDPGCI